MTYAEAMARYGTDKPDLRVDLELTDCTEFFATPRSGCSRRRTSAPSSCPGERASRASSSTPGRSGPSSAEPRGLAYVLVQEDGELGGPVAKNLSDEEKAGTRRARGREAG